MGRVCMGRVCYGPSLSWAEFVMGRVVQLPRIRALICIVLKVTSFEMSLHMRYIRLNLLKACHLRGVPYTSLAEAHCSVPVCCFVFV